MKDSLKCLKKTEQLFWSRLSGSFRLHCMKVFVGGMKATCNCCFVVGYVGDGIKCTDKDECQLGMHDCELDLECQNYPGSYSCNCQAGYEKTTNGNCVDINECSLGKCGSNSECTNAVGSFLCACQNGFEFNSRLWFNHFLTCEHRLSGIFFKWCSLAENSQEFRVC